MTQPMTRPDADALPWRFALAALGILVGLWLLRQALLPFFVAMVLAYLSGPVVLRLARRMPRPLAVGLVLGATIAAVVLLLVWLVPFLLDQGGRVVDSLPRWQAMLQQKTAPWMQAHPLLAAKVQSGLEGIDLGPALKGLWTAGSGVLSFFLSLLSLILVPLILFHLLEDGPAMLAFLQGLVPPHRRERVQALVADIHHRLGGYIRGQVAVAAVMSLLQGLAFQFLGIPYPWLLGLLAGSFNIIPYSPYLVALVPALVLAGLEGGGASRLLLVAGVFTAVQKVEALYLTPVWVGRASRLHSLEVLLALIAFGHWFGVLGLLFAVPLMVCVRVVLERLLEDYRAHPWFTGENPS